MQPPEPGEHLLDEGAVSVSGAVREFGMSRSAIYELMKNGRLPYCRPRGRRLIPRAAIRRLLAESLVRKEDQHSVSPPAAPATESI